MQLIYDMNLVKFLWGSRWVCMLESWDPKFGKTPTSRQQTKQPERHRKSGRTIQSWLSKGNDTKS